jgi:O-antigen/teichoic acid export membrane protein
MDSQYEISKRLVAINAASSIVAKLISVSIVLWLRQYLLRRVSTEDNALYELLISVIVLLPYLTSVLTSGVGRFVVSAYARNDQRGVTQVVSTIFPLTLMAGLVLLGGGLVLAWYVDKVLLIAPEQLWDARLMMALLVCSVAMRPVLSPFNIGFYVRQKYVLLNLIKIGTEVFRLSLLFILLFGVSTRVLWVVVANVGADICSGSVQCLISRRLVPALTFRVKEIRWGKARELMSFGLWSFLATASYRLRTAAIPFMLNRLATPMDVVVLGVGSLGQRQINQWLSVMIAPIAPAVTGMHALGERGRLRSAYLRGGRIALWIVMMAVVPATIFARPLIVLYATQRYAEAAVIMILTLASYVVAQGNTMLWQVANATGRVRAAGVKTLVSQVAVMAAVYLMLIGTDWGAFGVALVSFITGVVTQIILLWPLGLKLTNLDFGTWLRRTVLPGLAPACGAATVCALLNMIVRPDTWLELGLCVLGGILSYCAILLTACLEPNDRADLRAIATRVKSFARAG